MTKESLSYLNEIIESEAEAIRLELFPSFASIEPTPYQRDHLTLVAERHVVNLLRHSRKISELNSEIEKLKAERDEFRKHLHGK